jgi:hypothetical protein
MYKIKVVYRTGNSFGSYDDTDYLPLTWTDLGIAKENLRFIKEHWQQYMKIEGSYSRSRDVPKLLAESQNKEWFVKVTEYRHAKSKTMISEKDIEKYVPLEVEVVFNQYYAQNCIKLKTDAGTYMQMSCDWCGHFEKLHSAEIVFDDPDENDLKVEF